MQLFLLVFDVVHLLFKPMILGDVFIHHSQKEVCFQKGANKFLYFPTQYILFLLRTNAVTQTCSVTAGGQTDSPSLS